MKKLIEKSRETRPFEAAKHTSRPKTNRLKDNMEAVRVRKPGPQLDVVDNNFKFEEALYSL